MCNAFYKVRMCDCICTVFIKDIIVKISTLDVVSPGTTLTSPGCRPSATRTWVPTWPSSRACTSTSSTACRPFMRSTPTSSSTRTRWVIRLSSNSSFYLTFIVLHILPSLHLQLGQVLMNMDLVCWGYSSNTRLRIEYCKYDEANWGSWPGLAVNLCVYSAMIQYQLLHDAF